MKQWLRDQPLFVILLGIGSFTMYVPMTLAAQDRLWLYARTFFYHGTFLLIFTVMLGIAFSGSRLSNKGAVRIFDLFISFLLIPFALALPFNHLVPSIDLFDAYFEMLSSMTTTGATLFTDPKSLPDLLHFWRAFVAWMGGFLMLVAALGIFQPLQLGGFEVYSKTSESTAETGWIKRADIRSRNLLYARAIFPIYGGLTCFLTILLVIAGDPPLVALIHSMSTFSTSGISNIAGFKESGSGLTGEILIFLFLIFAVSRFMYQQDKDGRAFRNLKSDKEVNTLLIFLIVVPLILFLRHWTGAIEVEAEDDWISAFSALWGGLFMVMSFVTTTGFESVFWTESRSWSGLGNTGLILAGLAVMGGGIATTAGGVKLLRVYALYKHGLRELERLSFPSSVKGSGTRARKIRREGAYIAWVFFMLFLLSFAVAILLFTFLGTSFELSVFLAVSGLSTTGPLLSSASEGALNYAQLNDPSKAVFCFIMILGRLETLGVIAMFNLNHLRK